MRALYIEKERNAFDRLQKYLARATPVGIESKCLKGDFVALRSDILQWAGNDAFTFFFIDPKGYKEVGIEVLRPLLERPKSEFLINFMYNFLNRSVSLPALKEVMRDLLGDQVNIDGLVPSERESLILNTYRRNLKRCVPAKNARFPPRSGYVRVLHQKDDRPWYHLVYVTSHPKGLVEFMTISHSLDLVQKQVRADHKEALREAATGISDMFGDQEIAIKTSDKVSSQCVDQYWLDYLASGTRRIDTSAFAHILENTNWFPEDLQASLTRLIVAGKVRNISAGNSKRPRYPLHFEVAEGECLELS
jgi:three-Cys-motif partner protein